MFSLEIMTLISVFCPIRVWRRGVREGRAEACVVVVPVGTAN